MEQPPGSFDDLQPQDLSTSGLPAVIDLTRKRGEERVLNPASLDALRMVGSPGWYPNPGAGEPGLPYSESASSGVALQAGDQIQPDNAFSHTTVTLSYVSRSHVFSPHNSLSRSPLYSVPPISKFSLHPPCDADKRLGESGYALSQHYLAEEEAPMDLATQTGLFLPLSQTQTGELLVQEPHELNGGVVSSDLDIEMSAHGNDEDRASLEKNEGLENGQGDRWSSSGVCADSSPETPAPVAEEEEVLFLLSKKSDPGSESVGARDICSLRREYISPLEDPVSPSATSLGDVEDVFVLPQASCSPSGDNSYLEEVVCDGSATEGGIQSSAGIDDNEVRLDSSEQKKQPTRRRKALLAPLIDLTDDVCLSDLSENQANISKVVPHVNGTAKVLEKTFTARKLPMRSGRGTRLEAIVMNINSSRYRVSGCVRSSKKANASQSASSDSSFASPKKKDSPSVVKQKGKVKTSPSVKTIERKKSRRRQTNHINNDCCKSSTSDSEPINTAKKPHSSPPPKRCTFTVHTRSKKAPESVPPPVTPPRTSPLRPKRTPSSQSSTPATKNKSNKEPELKVLPEPSVSINEGRPSSPPLPTTSPKKSPGKAKSKSPRSKSSPPAKTKASCTPRRRRKRPKPSLASSSMFFPKEPEIKLKYLSYKEEKRDTRLDSFSPFVHVERKQTSPSLCTVVNYPDEVRMQHKKGQQPAAGSSFISAVIPSTSCLRLGRVSMHSQHQRTLVCCICGQSANAMDLGDLHGPYYPEGYRPNTKAPASASGLKVEDDYSDSDSSSYSMKGRGRKRAAPPTPWAGRPGAQLETKGVWIGEGTGSSAAKQSRSDPGSANLEDWYSPPVLPLEPCERWLHEDCGIWSAGVFLVKGKVYGLEEAVKAAQETVCSACHSPGATLGCLFKACPNKYHYRCALESDCVLIEENFSMKCKKHKNKTFKGPPGSRWNDR